MSAKSKSSGRTALECGRCQFKTSNYEKRWVEHLLKESHQKLAREASASSSAKSSKSKTKYVVSGIRNLQIKDVLKFFTSKQAVADFVFWTESPDVCLVRFLLSGGVIRSLAKTTKSIDGQAVSVRLRTSFSQAEWKSICPAEENWNKKEQTGNMEIDAPQPSGSGINEITLRNESKLSSVSVKEQEIKLLEEGDDAAEDNMGIKGLNEGNDDNKAKEKEQEQQQQESITVKQKSEEEAVQTEATTAASASAATAEQVDKDATADEQQSKTEDEGTAAPPPENKAEEADVEPEYEVATSSEEIAVKPAHGGWSCLTKAEAEAAVAALKEDSETKETDESAEAAAPSAPSSKRKAKEPAAAPSKKQKKETPAEPEPEETVTPRRSGRGRGDATKNQKQENEAEDSSTTSAPASKRGRGKKVAATATSVEEQRKKQKKETPAESEPEAPVTRRSGRRAAQK